jgi:hypothetical protein
VEAEAGRVLVEIVEVRIGQPVQDLAAHRPVDGARDDGLVGVAGDTVLMFLRTKK